MRYHNPVVSGFYPDPSVCEANGKFYLACSSFQYFPGVPLFESVDLINWKQIGHVLTRKSQVMLEKVASSGGVFAPTIRFHEGRFYMVTNNNTTSENFYVYTDDIYGEWSEPITVDQGGIDPSLLFDQGHVYFISNGQDEHGVNSVIQCEINIETGKKLSPSKPIWQGAGGRYLESPHMYHIGNTYYLVVAEGGTEYGHMVSYSRSDNVWGPFENYPHNPVLTNRNKAPEEIQGIGHGDLVQKADGSWYIMTLGFRQIHKWQPFHHLGRETFLTPVSFHQDGWFTAGDGTTAASYEIPGDFVQQEKKLYTFENTDWNLDWIYLRHPHTGNYEPEKDRLTLHGTNVTLEDVDSPTFLGIRQKDFCMNLSVRVTLDQGEAGLTMYMDELEHYDIAIRTGADGYEAVLKINIGTAKHTLAVFPLTENSTRLLVVADHLAYHFYLISENASGSETKTELGSGYTKYLSSEVAGGFTGVVMGLYAIGENTAVFTDFRCEYL